MGPQTLRCPACGAPDTSVADAYGVHRCEHCGVAYRLGEQDGLPVQVGATAARSAAVPTTVAVLGIILILVGAGLAFVLLALNADQIEVAPPVPVAAQVPATAETPATAELPATAETPATAELPATAEAPATAQVTVYGTAPGYQTSFYVLAEVKNTSPFPISKPELTVVLKDASGAELARDHGYAELEELAPGASSPVRILVSQPPAYQDLAVEVAPRRATFAPALAPGLTVVDTLPPAEGRPGRYKLTGKVHNGGSAPARFLKVVVVARDAQGAIIALDDTFASTDGLPPGGDARFELDRVRCDAPSARWEYLLVGRAAE